MQITVNGETTHLSGISNVDELIRHLALDVRRIAVEKNREIVPRSRLAETTVTEGDALEIVTFIGGG